MKAIALTSIAFFIKDGSNINSILLVPGMIGAAGKIPP